MYIYTAKNIYGADGTIHKSFLPAKAALCPALQLSLHSLHEPAIPGEPFSKRLAVESQAYVLPDPIHIKL